MVNTVIGGADGVTSAPIRPDGPVARPHTWSPSEMTSSMVSRTMRLPLLGVEQHDQPGDPGPRRKVVVGE